MRHVASYKVRLAGTTRSQRDALEATVRVYREALSFLVGVVDSAWDEVEKVRGGLARQRLVETWVHASARNPEPRHPEFDQLFYKLPSYLRRSAITSAIGKVAAYKANLSRWEESGRKGGEPKLSHDHFDFPVLYKQNMFVRDGETSCRVKVFDGNDWTWLDLDLRPSDIRYIDRMEGATVKNPRLERKGKVWSLRFCVERDAPLTEEPEECRRVCAVDLGINKCATMAVVEPDGTVIGRKCFDLPGEKDRLARALGRVKKAQQSGSRRTPRLWALADYINSQIARKTARAIVDFAALYSCDVIVFEHLEFRGKARGSKKQRLHLWRKREVQKVAESQAHLLGMRVSRVNAWNTSCLAFDGSGRVERGRGAGLPSYSTVRFATGKVYDADLNAAYNIAARYLVRAVLKSLPETVRLDIRAKVPGCSRRTTCTLSSLISLRAELAASSRHVPELRPYAGEGDRQPKTDGKRATLVA